MKLIILLSILTYSKLLPVNLEFSFGGGVGGSMEFSYTEGINTIPSENGSRVDRDYFQIVKHFLFIFKYRIASLCSHTRRLPAFSVCASPESDKVTASAIIKFFRVFYLLNR